MNQTNDFGRRVSTLIEASIATKKSMLSSGELISTVAIVSEILVRALKQGNKALIFGNGGCAADAQHIAAELVGRFAFDRPALPALALSLNGSCVTAIGNDYGCDLIFSRQVEALARRGDVVIGISTTERVPSDVEGSKDQEWYLRY
jgi:D-sedoheptulose 7-phosphate isomerase